MYTRDKGFTPLYLNGDAKGGAHSMFSVLRRFLFTILLAQWIYAEAVLIAPQTQPALDTISQFLRPPTHDKWVSTYRAFQVKREKFAEQMNSMSQADVKDGILDSFQSFASTEGLESFK